MSGNIHVMFLHINQDYTLKTELLGQKKNLQRLHSLLQKRCMTFLYCVTYTYNIASLHTEKALLVFFP